MAWTPIRKIPEQLLDGRPVKVRRRFESALIAEGEARFDVPDSAAPMLQPDPPHPLGYKIDREAEAAQIEAARITKRWLRPDRLHAFPEPTHFWLEAPE